MTEPSFYGKLFLNNCNFVWPTVSYYLPYARSLQPHIPAFDEVRITECKVERCVGGKSWIKNSSILKCALQTKLVDFLNVRSGPGTNNKVVRRLMSNALVKLIEKEGRWYRIGAKEWVHEGYIELIEWENIIWKYHMENWEPIDVGHLDVYS